MLFYRKETNVLSAATTGARPFAWHPALSAKTPSYSLTSPHRQIRPLQLAALCRLANCRKSAVHGRRIISFHRRAELLFLRRARIDIDQLQGKTETKLEIAIRAIKDLIDDEPICRS